MAIEYRGVCVSEPIKYRDEVDQLTLGQCYDHPKWRGNWIPDWNSAPCSWRIISPSWQPVTGYKPSHVAAARAALATVLEERPQPVDVTEEDVVLSRELAAIVVPQNGSQEQWHRERAELIAAYRAKHTNLSLIHI